MLEEAIQQSPETGQVDAIVKWRSVQEERPEHLKEVLVCRPNQYSGKTDLLIARLHPKKEEGQKYGRSDEWDKITYDDYWSFPGISPIEACTYWAYLPEPKDT